MKKLNKVFKGGITKAGKLISYNPSELFKEITVNSELSTTLEVDTITNNSYNWIGPLLLKNINGLEGQIVNVRSTSGQEISSGGNIVLYPEEPDKSFKEAMKSTPYTFRCTDGKWVKIK